MLNWHMKFALLLIVTFLCLGWGDLLISNHRAVYASDVNWQTVGEAGFSEGAVAAGNSMITTVSIDVDEGVPYVAYADESKGGRLVVQAYNGAIWEFVGEENGISDNEASGISLVLYDGTPYVAYTGEEDFGPDKVYVKKYNGTTWESLGSEVGYTSATTTSLSVYEGTPYVAFVNNSTGSIGAYSFSGGGWSSLGSSGLSRGSSVSIDVYEGTPYLGYRSLTPQAIVAKLNGSIWESLEQASLSTVGSQKTIMQLDNGTPYVAYFTPQSKATVTKYIGEDGWESVGTPEFSPNGSYTAFAMDVGIPYFGFRDSSSSEKATVMTFDGSVWKTVGTAGFSQGEVGNLAFTIDDGSAYLAYIDEANGDKATVMKYDLYQIAEFADQTLAHLKTGYVSGTQEKKKITIQRAYSGKLDNLTVRLTGKDADSFTISQPLEATLDNMTPETTFTVQAKDTLGRGTYTATIVVEADHARAQEFAVTQSVLLQTAKPSAEPLGGRVPHGETVTLTTTTAGAAIHYTTDGSEPTSSSAEYTSPIEVTADMTIKAIAVKDGMMDSEVMEEHYTIQASEQVARPAATPAGGAVETGTAIALATVTSGAKVYFTTDGSEPTSSSAEYTSPIEVTADMTIKAIAVKDGMMDSEVMTEQYTIATKLEPTNLTASAGDRSVTLKWNEVIGKGTVTYMVYQVEGSSAPDDPANWRPIQATIMDSSYTVTGLTNGKPYTFAVKANDAEGDSDFSNIATATPRATPESGGSGGSRDRPVPVLSDDAHLTELQVWADDINLTLSPAFSSGVMKYRGDTEAEQVDIMVKRADSGAKVMLRDKVLMNRATVDLEEGDNTFVLIVQAENGTKKNYTLTLTRKALLPAEPAEFTDIAGHWAESEIKRATSESIVNGYPNSVFKPNHPITRAEFTVMLANVLELEGEGATLVFSDIDQTGWANPALAQAVQEGIVTGYEDGSFRPNAPITRAEVAVMVARALKVNDKAYASTSFTDDKDIPQWAKASVEAIHQQGLVNGREGERFVANDKATRAETTIILLRMLETKRDS
ncbi:chitobiase/beta-hexosaminidase C-terminal domain-containing protein [Halalkalibacter oceani]|uniref:chitobiase/beta-hexosaminidase C-terminal domain-containing protein n=1 Tax=Halalkalibacter oceani TaxID=1653776 RepID=UPI003399863D